MISPWPEIHIDDGLIEVNVRRAQMRMFRFLMSDVEAHASLVESGLSAEDAHLAIVGAKLLEAT